MNLATITKSRNITSRFVDAIKKNQERIHAWLAEYENSMELPLYSSVDIRDGGFKIAVVDTNIFPAGFNNLCEHGLSDSIRYIREAIVRRSLRCKNILIIAEEHTRNTWYLENIRILQQIIEKSGFNVHIATFLDIQPAFCKNANYIELETATGNPVKIFCLRKILSMVETDNTYFDLIILNNDLTAGIPDILASSHIPIYPSIQAGWHSRLKSNHFHHTQNLIEEFCEITSLDPWFFSCIHASAGDININSDADRSKIRDLAAELFTQIQKKYQEYKIDEKPFIFVKADSGTYGMGVVPIESPNDVLGLNRRNRNKLHKGKSAKQIDRVLLQEGVASIHSIDQGVSEVCIYQIENNLIGGFYRSNSAKSDRENLNSQGMDFKKMCPHKSDYGECNIHPNINIFDIYRILSRIAAVAVSREIDNLESKKK